MPFRTAFGAFDVEGPARTGSVAVPRSCVAILLDGTEVKLGVFPSDAKSRRARLTGGKTLMGLGLEWAAA
ncbi:hypothetical protein [Streptomyces roseoverticillatus]|uniref:Uncharacterized protein n=1 Tax=Streptomyces roseoverticillatus TaxID=66429 RepID=A0ABV3J459_9ACTN